MNIGEQMMVSINDSEFHAIEYKSCDEKIATIDESGNIHAVKRGMTYIRVIASEGEVAIRIEVSDKNNLIDDYTEFLGKPIGEAINSLGNLYTGFYYNGTTILTFNIIDDKIKRLNFYYFVEKRVYLIEGDFLDSTDLSEIISYFDEKYIALSTENPHRHDYLSFNYKFYISINDEMRSIDCSLLENDFEMYDGIIEKNIDEVAERFKFKLNDNNTYFDEKRNKNFAHAGEVCQDSRKFQYAFYIYDPISREISNITLKCFSGVKFSDIESWYDENYIIHYPNNKKRYATSPNYLMSEYFIEVYEDSGYVYVEYLLNKTNWQ